MLHSNKNLELSECDNRKKRKISFKVKNGSQKKNFNSTTLSANKVKELTNKFNELMSQKEPEIQKMVKRVNSKLEKPKIRPKPKVELRKKLSIRSKTDQKTLENRHSVRETIAIFENKSQTTPKVSKVEKKIDMYETLKITKTTSSKHVLKMAENKITAIPNNSFLWRQKSKENVSLNVYSSIIYDDINKENKIITDTGQNYEDNIYDAVEPKTIDEEIQNYEKLLKKTDDIINEYKSSHNDDTQVLETAKNEDTSSVHNYELYYSKNIYETPETDNIYETLYPQSSTILSHPNPGMDTPTKSPTHSNIGADCDSNSENIYSTINEISSLVDKNREAPHPQKGVASIPNTSHRNTSGEGTKLGSYESIENIVFGNTNVVISSESTPKNGSSSGSNRDSIVSYDLQNSLYGKYSPTNFSSGSSNAEEWVDLSDQEFENSGFVVIRDKHKLSKKNSGWSNKVREQWSKNNNKNSDEDALSDTYHYYESLNSDEYDSFDSDSDCDSKIHQNDSGVEMGMANLPDIPKMGVASPQYGFTKLAQRLRKNWSLTKNDITKSLSRMTKKNPQKNLQLSTPMSRPRAVSSPVLPKVDTLPEVESEPKLSNSLSRKKNWLNFRRAQSLSENSQLQIYNPNLTKSTFYINEQKPQVPVRKKMQRPQIPPPPIPNKGRNTSWYLDTQTKDWCDYENLKKEEEKNKKQVLQKPDLIPNSVFYTDDDTDPYYNVNKKFSTLLKDEPLYQFYDAEFTENCLSISSSDSEYDGYETVGSTEIPQRNSLRNILKTGRTLWCEVPEVIRAEVLPSLNQTQKKLQEAKFEILTSETSYFNSLSILTEHFIPKICQDNFLTTAEQKILFGNINSVKKTSEKFLNDLENEWNDSIFLTNVCAIIKKYSDQHFDCYVDYCANQGLADNVLRKCKIDTSKNGKSPQLSRFGQAIKELELNSNCQGLSLHSFLMLPMQRVTRLPLLVDAVLRRLNSDDDDFMACQKALRSLQDLVARCNEAARQTERILELEKLKKQLEFPQGMPTVDLLEIGAKRFLVKSGDLVQLLAKGGTKTNEEGIKLTFGKRFQKISLTIFLFEDWVIVGKKKSEDSFVVLHHCSRSFLELSPPESQITLDSSLLLFLTLLENQDGRQVSFLLSCACETERERWVEALSPTKMENANEVIYESWDCPQVQVIHDYNAQQPDELNLKRGDVVNVDRKMTDQWFHGQKIIDSQQGWFPGNFVVEVANPHVRARNLRQRYRLLALTDEYLNNSLNK